MTEKLYYTDQYIKEFEASVVSCVQAGNRYEVILDRTAFFPEGGGQPGDTGFINDAKVIDTIERDGTEIHICDKNISGKCICRLNWDRRFLNMQKHSGEHIFSGFLHHATGFDNVGFHMGEKEVTVDFNGFVSPEILENVEIQTNKAIYENIPVEALYPSTDELKNYDYRSKKEIRGQVRLVRIPGADLCACCGTHVARTGEVGIVKVVGCENYKQGVRITLAIGRNALDDYMEKNKSVAAISASLCAKTGEVAPAVEKLKEKLSETKYELSMVKRSLFVQKTENTGKNMPVIFLEGENAEDARICADILADKVRIAFVFSGKDESGYKYSVISRTEDVRQTGKDMNEALNGRGGGKPECIQGSVASTAEEIKEYIKSVVKE